MKATSRIRCTIIAAILVMPLPLSAQPASAPPGAAPPLPDLKTFVAQTRSHIRLDNLVRADYTCLQRETEVKLDGDGRPTGTSTRVYEIYPAAGGAGSYRRLVSRDGVPLPAAELAENDRRRQSEVEQQARAMQRENPGEREKRLRREAEERREHEALLDEVFRLMDFRMLGREWLAGRPTIVLAIQPRSGAKAVTRMGSMVQKVTGRVWVDERDFEAVRVEARAADDITYGLGLFARVYKGTTLLWERQKVNGEAWVPARLEIRASGRFLLFRRLGLHRVTDYFNYRRLTAASASASFGSTPR